MRKAFLKALEHTFNREHSHPSELGACFLEQVSPPQSVPAHPPVLGDPQPADPLPCPSPPAHSEVTLQAKGQATCYSFLGSF